MKNERWLNFILGFGIGVCIYFLTDVRNVQIPNGTEQEKVDTVYLTKFIPVESYKRTYTSTKFYFFTEVDTVEIEKISLIHDTVFISTKDSSQILYDSQFLTQYPFANKLVQLLLENENLSLSLLDTQGQLSTQSFKLDLSKYRYNYQPTGMTYKRVNFFKRLQPFAEIQVRPLNLMLDGNIGIYHKTGKTKYEFGLNGFYYPNIQNTPGYDIYFNISYEF